VSAPQKGRREFLKTAGVLTVGAAAGGGATACHVADPKRAEADDSNVRVLGFDRALLDAVATAVLPESLGAEGIKSATDRFVAWVDAYDPVAEEMHGYGYSDIRYLPADPAPAWRAQLTGLEVLARRTHHQRFVQLSVTERRTVVAAALRDANGERLPNPLGARHVVLALLAHWASSPDAWNRALGVQVSPNSCRKLDEAPRKPLPIAGVTA
jgi:hypothetical protein